jgi:hypothetical protein
VLQNKGASKGNVASHTKIREQELFDLGVGTW